MLVAWEEFSQEKEKRADVRIFALTLLHNVRTLRFDLINFNYRHANYEAFKINDPKPRNIHKATVRDRVLHRAIYRVLYPDFDRTFIFDSYSCRNEKGTHRAFLRLVHFARKISRNYTSPCWALKMDIKKFFDSVDHEILIRLLTERIGDPKLLCLLKQIVHSFEFSPGKGMPLGNLTSQLFANIFLDPLDKFVKHRLKAKYYLRYADDFLILADNPEELMGYFVEINQFLKTVLKLQIHPNKVHLRRLSWGIDFVGYVALPHYFLPRNKTVRRIWRQIDKTNASSYFGHLSHVNSYELVRNLRNKLDRSG